LTEDTTTAEQIFTLNYTDLTVGNDFARVLQDQTGNDLATFGSTPAILTYLSNASNAGPLASSYTNLILNGNENINGRGNSRNNTITGNAGDNSLMGGSGDDTISGGAGNDTLDGGTGADSLAGGVGDDVYAVDSTTDVIIELLTEGTDLIRSSVTYAMQANIENLTLTGTAAINGTGNSLSNVLTGNTGNNSLVGGAGNDTLNGGGGVDTLIGGSGDDTYVISSNADIIIELSGEGADLIRSSVTCTMQDNIENLTLIGTAAVNGTGNSLSNVLTGNIANNSLDGGLGDDTLVGGIGRDTITGGSGKDLFSFAAGDALISGTTSLSFDRITDFAIGVDRLNGVTPVSSINLNKLGTVGASLTSTTIASLLTTTAFTANGAAAFTFGSGAGLRTFIGLNDAVAGFQASTDNIIEITNYTGNLANLSII